MSTSAAKLLEDAMRLSDAERADLAACLFASLGTEVHEVLSAEWEDEIARRLHAIDTDSTTLSPWEEARLRIFRHG